MKKEHTKTLVTHTYNIQQAQYIVIHVCIYNIMLYKYIAYIYIYCSIDYSLHAVPIQYIVHYTIHRTSKMYEEYKKLLVHVPKILALD